LTSGVALTAAGLIALRSLALAHDPAPSLAALPGGFPTRRKGQGLEVVDRRDYVAGDDIRHIDRTTTARTGRLHTRQFQEERDRVSLLIADFRPSMFWGVKRALRSVAAAEALSLIGWRVVESGGRVGLLALTGEEPFVVPARGRVRGMLDVIGAMVDAHRAAFEALRQGSADDPPLDQALSRADRLVPSGAELLIASGFDTPGAGLGDRLEALARRRRPRLVLVTDAEAGALPKGRYAMRLADGRLARVHLDSAGEDPALQRVVAGKPALVINASDPLTTSARRLSAAFATRRAA
jgi:uncharacterized protein (DUF58 family)